MSGAFEKIFGERLGCAPMTASDCAMAQDNPSPKTIKIASWNINSVRARVEIVERFLVDYAPDILCLQETKVVNGTFPEGLFRRLGYNHQMLNGQPMHHGVAILSKIPMRDDDRLDWQANGEARHIGVRLDNGLRIENVYIPAGGEEPDRTINHKFGQKLDFLERMIEWSSKLDVPTLLLGDFNVAPLECDVWSHKQLINVVSHTRSNAICSPGCRPAMAGWTLAACSTRRPHDSTHGGAIARWTGPSRIAAGASIICG